MNLDLRRIAAALGGEVSKDQVSAPGPGHSAADRSLSVRLDAKAPDGFLVHSFASDDPIACKAYVREKCDLPAFKANGARQHRSSSDVAKLMREAVLSQQQEAPKGRLIATHDYTDANGVLLYQVLKYEPKDYLQRRPDGNGGWIWDRQGRRVLFRLPELLKYPDATVFFTEGEKDADRVASLGHCATTLASGTWTSECAPALAGRDVWILEDNDDKGRKRAQEAAEALNGTAKSIRVVRLPGLPDRGDVSDWLDAGHSSEELIEACTAVPLWKAGTGAEKSNGAQQEPEKQRNNSVTLTIKSSKQFVAEFVPPDYIVDGLLQEGFLYSLTGATGAGKTAITLPLAASTALGVAFAGRETKKRRVLYLAGENPTDVRMRWIAISQRMDFDPDTIEVYFIDKVFKISEAAAILEEETAKLGGDFGLVIIDTGPVFYEGDDESSRTQQGNHAKMLRGLIAIIPGKPAIVANCHPVKNAPPDNLIPAGGGNFLNQVDGNLTASKTDSTTEVYWQGKFRGVEFAPMHFLLKTVTHERLKDSKGRLMPTVISEWISDTAKEEIAKQRVTDEDELLAFIAADPKASQATFALKMGWKLFSGDPNKVKAGRCIKRLVDAKLINITRAGNYTLTDKGKAALEEVGRG
jgi:AAA domain